MSRRFISVPLHKAFYKLDQFSAIDPELFEIGQLNLTHFSFDDETENRIFRTVLVILVNQSLLPSFKLLPAPFFVCEAFI